MERRPTALIVDDEVINRVVIQQLLQLSGVECVVVGNGSDAIAAVQEQSFDVIFMDLQMPDLDGFETARRIRAIPETGERMRVFALTAFAPKDIAQQVDEAGFDGILQKPVAIEQLREVFELD